VREKRGEERKFGKLKEASVEMEVKLIIGISIFSGRGWLINIRSISCAGTGGDNLA
jgi:hypothetical protein